MSSAHPPRSAAVKPLAAIDSRTAPRRELPFIPLLWVIALAVGAAHLPSAFRPHFEGDEVVFTFLAERLAHEPLRYTLRGPLSGAAAQRFINDTWLHTATQGLTPEQMALARRDFAALTRAEVLYEPFSEPPAYAYAPDVYDTPMFFHPPIYPYALAAARVTLGSAGGPLLAAGAAIVLIVLTGFLGRAMFGAGAGLIAAALVALDPVSWMCAERVWIDGPLQAVVVAAVLSAWTFSRGPTPGRAALGGALLGLACLTKFTAALVVPAIVVAALLSPQRPRIRQVLIYLASAAALIVPWLIINRVYYGAWLPAARPTPWLLEKYEYVRMLVARPIHFYVSGLLIVSPVCAFAPFALAQLRRRRTTLLPLAWAFSYLVALTALGAAGQGLQLRYLAPALPAFALLVAATLATARWYWLALATLLAIAGAVGGAVTAAQPPAAEPLPVAANWLVSLGGADLRTLLPGMWSAR